jgi:hypothetical protein
MQQLQVLSPQTLACALTDSLVGLLDWLLERCRASGADLREIFGPLRD